MGKASGRLTFEALNDQIANGQNPGLMGIFDVVVHLAVRPDIQLPQLTQGIILIKSGKRDKRQVLGPGPLAAANRCVDLTAGSYLPYLTGQRDKSALDSRLVVRGD